MFLTPQTQTLIDQHYELIEANLQRWIQQELDARKDDSKIESRKAKFKNSIAPHVKEYGSPLCNEFYKYWTEPNKSGKKMRFELEKTWEIKRRLERWKKTNASKQKGAIEPAIAIPRKEGTNNQHILDQLYANIPNP